MNSLHQEIEIITMAQQICEQDYGKARMPGNMRRYRLDRGKSQPELHNLTDIGVGAGKTTLKSYLCLRRASVEALSGTDGATFDIVASLGNLPS